MNKLGLYQAMGRAGRITAAGERTYSLLYILYNSQAQFTNILCHSNSQDLGRNMRGMSDGVRQLCLSTQTCLRSLLKKRFVGGYAANSMPTRGFCCSVCDKIDSQTFKQMEYQELFRSAKG